MSTYPLASWVYPLLGHSHRVEGRLHVSVDGSPFGEPLPLVSGSVAVSLTSPARRELHATVLADIDSPLVSPLHAEVFAEYGVFGGAGQVEWVPVGVFVVTATSEGMPGEVALTGVDRWQRVVDARFGQPVTTSGSTALAVTTLLTDADPRITVDATAAPEGTHVRSLWEGDRTAAVTQLARSIGAVVYFNPVGVAVIEPVPTLTAGVDWVVARGHGGVKVGARRQASRERFYNEYNVTGEPPGLAPVYGVARDLRPGSSTRWGGPAGKKGRMYRSQLVTTQAQAAAVAAAGLARCLTIARSLAVETLPHPGLDAGSLLSVEVVAGVWERHLAESFTLPLGAGTTPIETASDAADDEGDVA